MSETSDFDVRLPPEADGAVQIVRTLRDAGHQALLAGGCVRDLLLGRTPEDFDVVTDATPDRIAELFPRTRHVGVQFGVVLVRRRGRWVEVATFRTDGPYLDGRRPSGVHFTDARHDALRRDFTINGMFLDPLRRELVDYVGGREDLAARRIRAIGEPAQRFAEDYLRMLRAARFAARLEFQIEPATFAALRASAPCLCRVAPERIRDELERMLEHPSRADAVQWMDRAGMLAHLWPDAVWDAHHVAEALRRLRALPGPAPFALAFALLLADRSPQQIERIARLLACSNEQRQTAAWLVEHQADLDEPARPTLAELKRLMAHPAFDLLRRLAESRYAALPDGPQRATRLAERLAAIPPERVQPPALVTGDDLIRRGVPPGPIYKHLLDELYTRQLDEQLDSRDAALDALDRLLRHQT